MTYRRTIRRRFNKRNVGGSNKKVSKKAKKPKKNTKRRKQRCKSKEDLSVEMVFLPRRKKNRT